MLGISERASTATVKVGTATVPFHDSGTPRFEGSARAPVVLLHGTGGTTMSHYGLVFPVLEQNQRVIGVDFAAPADLSSLSLDDLVAQAGAVIAHTCPGQPVTLVGYSLGAVVAAALAGRHPDLVHSLVLVAGWITSDAQQRMRNSVWNALYDSAQRRALAEFTVYAAFSAPFLKMMPPARLEGVLGQIAPGPFDAAQMRVNRDIDIAADVARITAPTLVIGCTRDNMVPVGHSKALFGAIENSRYFEAESGHAIIYERSAELALQIDQFNQNPGRHPAGSRIAADRP